MTETKAKSYVSFKELEAVKMELQSYTSSTQWGGGRLMTELKRSTQIYLDRFAISLSVLCVIHCMAVPVLLIMFPSLMASFHLDDHVFHELLVWFAIPTSAIAVFLGCKRHKDQLVVALAGLGLALLTVAAFLGHDAFGETGEKVVTLVAASILALAHWRNYALCRHDLCQH